MKQEPKVFNEKDVKDAYERGYKNGYRDGERSGIQRERYSAHDMGSIEDPYKNQHEMGS